MGDSSSKMIKKLKVDASLLGLTVPTTKAPISSSVANANNSLVCECVGLPSSKNVNITELPSVVLEKILCQVPLFDLLRSGSRVCKSWNEIISAPSFMPWKKKYHMIKADVKKIDVHIKKPGGGMDFPEMFLLELIIHISTAFNRIPVRNAEHHLQKHRLYDSAERLIREKVPECVKNSIVNMWAIVAAMVVLSETVADVYGILKYLVNGPCPVQDALEVLYCIATFLLYVSQHFSLTYGLHYRVFYTLYLYENSKNVRLNTDSDVNPLKNGCEEQFQLTQEQMRIVDHCLEPHDVVKIIGYAGSGKTSTLIEFARRNPTFNILFVLQNDNVVEQVKGHFPSNLDCHTIYSLARSNQGSKFERKLDNAQMNPYTILPHLKDARDYKGQDNVKHARLVIVTIMHFVASADQNITPLHARGYHDDMDDLEFCGIDESERVAIAKNAQVIWEKMIDPEDLDVTINQDCYLKLYQLEHPVLNSYDCIIIDNAQDHSPAVFDILLSQKCAKILAGDPHQEIHEYRPLFHSLSNVASTHTYGLTQSFRFGPEIAFMASLSVQNFRDEDRRTLVGGTQKCSVTGSHVGQVAILTCYTGTLFEEVVRICFKKQRRSYDPPNVVGAFAGGTSFDHLVDIYHLMQGNLDAINDKFFGKFENISDLQNFASKEQDFGMKNKICVVEKYTSLIPEYVKAIKRLFCEDISKANVIFSTVENAKGMEFDTVCLLEDYHFEVCPGFWNDPPSLEYHFNMLYTAITRAKKCLCMPLRLKIMLLMNCEKFERYEEIQSVECCICKEVFRPGTLVTTQCRLQLVEGYTLEGYICGLCSLRKTVSYDSLKWYEKIRFETMHGTRDFLNGISLDVLGIPFMNGLEMDYIFG